jgi:hypothetical protein
VSKERLGWRYWPTVLWCRFWDNLWHVMSGPDERKLRRLCFHCQCGVHESEWLVNPPDRIGSGPCDVCGKHRLLVQEVYLTDGEVAELILR